MKIEGNFKRDEGGNLLIEKNYKTKRMKELTTEINELQHQIKLIERQLHDKKNFLKRTKSLNTFKRNIS